MISSLHSHQIVFSFQEYFISIVCIGHALVYFTIFVLIYLFI